MTELINCNEKTFKGFSGSTLKIVAIITMLIDHIGAVVLEPLISGFNPVDLVLDPKSSYDTLYVLSRSIGRIAFPLFCFLLVEGFVHTSNVKKYALRLGIFALISEIPFDLAFRNGNLVDFSYQNVFFTLLIGLGALYLIEKYKNNNKILTLVSFIGACALAELLRTDYGMMGIIPIVVFYVTRGFKKRQVIGGFLSFLFEAPLFLLVYVSLPLIYFYNGKRGLSLKYIFYAFYPCHLLILYMIKIYLI